MKKELQKIENGIVLQEIEKIDADLQNGVQSIRQLRYCNAYVLFTSKYYVLKSYSTIVAAIVEDGNLYDFLRYVYGYTSTSAQHIAKFRNDYARNGKRFTYYPI